MLNLVPKYERSSKVFQNKFNIDKQEISKLDDLIDNIEDQLFLETATWGLDFYEKELGINIDHSKSYFERRKLIKAKRKSPGVLTKNKLINIIEGFIDDPKVIEDYSNYKFNVELNSSSGFP